MSETDRQQMREMTARLGELTSAARAIGTVAQRAHLLLLDTGLVEPAVAPSWEVEREDFLRRQESA